jgi:formate hydrogenlyase subunit 4
MSYVAGAAQIGGVAIGAPLVIGAMRQVRARSEGRYGGGVLQPWRDLRKQLRKQQVTPEGTTLVFAAAPAIVAGTTLLIAAIAPLVATGSPLDPVADLFAVVGLLFLGTVALTLAGIDTGTSFGGMGASREITIAALVEPTILLAVFALSVPAGSSNLGTIVAHAIANPGQVVSLTGVLAFVALVIVIIAETGRLPVDNPATHLELTMVHEAMVLEYAGPRLAHRAAGAPGEPVPAVGYRRHAAEPDRCRDRCRGDRCQSRRPGGRTGRRRGLHRQAAAVPGARTARGLVPAGAARGHVGQLLHGGGVTR